MFTDRLFEGKYKILEILGSGGMSTVYLAQNVKLGTLWAIKEINRKTNPKIDLFVEPNILKKLNHPALPRIFDIVEEEENIYVIVDFIEGIALDKEIDKVKAFEEDIVIDWSKQLCEVLNYLHTFKPNPIIYRDMKPSNIILTKNGSVKLIDFGIAREYKRDCGNDTVYIGTRGYAAPEQYGNSQTNVTTDIYSLGITLLHLLSGTSPNDRAFENKVLEYSKKNNVNGFERIISKCIQLNSADRYQSIQDLLYDIKIYEKSKINQASKQNTNNSISSGNEASFNKVASFKRLVLTIWGNSEFASEFAYLVAKYSKHNVLLIDLDLLSPSTDLYLNINKFSNNISGEGNFNTSGFNVVMDSLEKNCFSLDLLYEASAQRKELKNLNVLTGSYSLENYEYYNNNTLMELIDKSYQNFDITILIVNKFIYDSFTVLGLLKSNYNIIPLKADIKTIRDFNRYLVFLKDKQHISIDKTKFVAFEYNVNTDLSKAVIEEVTQNNFIGSIRYNEKRCEYRNKKLPFVRRVDDGALKEYFYIFKYFNIIPKDRITDKLSYWFMSLGKALFILLKSLRFKKKRRVNQ